MSISESYLRYGKRAMDVVVAGGALAIAGLPMLLVAAGVLLFLGRPVLFRQRRAGKHGMPFTMLKFRTMTNATDANGRLLPDAARLTAFGKFLRSTSLDELPNLWNVLTGDMSLVGPRPLPVEYVPLYTPEQARRLDMVPGLVSLNGLYERVNQSWETMFHYDVQYTERVSPKEDLRIILGMIPVVLSRNGAERGDHGSDSPFAQAIAAQRATGGE